MNRFTRRRCLGQLSVLVAPLAATRFVFGADEKISDDLLFDRVSRGLVTDPQLGAHPLQITVQAGKVTVTGLVDNDKLRKRVDKVVKKVKGVREVDNQVRIRR